MAIPYEKRIDWPRIYHKYRRSNLNINALEMIAKSLNGNYREEHLFALQQSVELFDIYQAKIMECDQAVKNIWINMLQMIMKIQSLRIKRKKLETMNYILMLKII